MADIITKKVPLKSIVPDVDQPRKNFDATKIAQLAKSIQKHGIMNPLVVEEHKSGYVLVDGERRFRAATELGLKEVPVNIIKAETPAERLIRQFHLQEQHEGWSAIEKAKGVIRLAEELSLSVEEVGEMLSLPARTIRDYMAYGKLIATKEFDKSEMPVHFAHKIVSMRTMARNEFMKHDEEFTLADEEKLEKAVIARAKAGDIRNARDLVMIKDALKTNYKSLRGFMSGKQSVQNLFLESNGKAAAAYRNTMFSVRYAHQYISRGMGLGLPKFLTEKDRADIKRTIQALQALAK